MTYRRKQKRLMKPVVGSLKKSTNMANFSNMSEEKEQDYANY